MGSKTKRTTRESERGSDTKTEAERTRIFVSFAGTKLSWGFSYDSV